MVGMTKQLLSRLEDFNPSDALNISFEFFPPKTPDAEDSLWNTIKILEPLNPDFVSVTYGAGGTTRDRTHKTLLRIKEETTLTPAAHLTCVNATRGEIDKIARGYWDAGIKHIVALRGDPINGDEGYTPHPDGYAYASDLVAGLKNIADFEISVAAYPEKHPEAIDLDSDIEFLKRKIDAGANRAITQFFLNADTYLHFLDKCLAANINVPIVPGIILINNFTQFKRFAKMCGTTIPSWVRDLLEGQDDFPASRDILSAMIAVEQCRILNEAGIKDFHFYTLNKPDIARTICHLLGHR